MSGTREVNYIADVTSPSITSITSTTADGVYSAGVMINISVNFSEPVILAGGNLNVTLNTIPAAVVPVSAGAYPAQEFTGTYTVQQGQNSLRLNVAGMELESGATLKDDAGHDAIFTFPAGNNLSDNKNIVIDTIAPTVTITSPSAGSFVRGHETIVFSLSKMAIVKASVNDTDWVDAISGTTQLSEITGWEETAEGAFTLKVQATDAVGNIGTTPADLNKTSMLIAGKITCFNQAGFVMYFEVEYKNAEGNTQTTRRTRKYPINQKETIDMSKYDIPAGAEVCPKVKAVWGKTNCGGKVIYQPNGAVAGYRVSGTTLIYKVTLVT